MVTTSDTPARTPRPVAEVPFDSRGPVPSGCYEVTAMPSQAPMTVESLAGASSTILLGTFHGHDEARWNTPDGHRPTPSELVETSARLHRPMRLTVERVIRGAADDAAHAFDPSGRLDCDMTAVIGGRELVIGQRYVFFLFAVSNSVGAMSGDRQLVDAWPVGTDDVVETAQQGPIPLTELLERIERTPVPDGA